MRKVKVLVSEAEAGVLEELEPGKHYAFRYNDEYHGEPVSLTLPVKQREFRFDRFPAFFDAFLPEGISLEVFLQREKLDKGDLFGQLLAIGGNHVGAVSVKRMP